MILEPEWGPTVQDAKLEFNEIDTRVVHKNCHWEYATLMLPQRGVFLPCNREPLIEISLLPPNAIRICFAVRLQCLRSSKARITQTHYQLNIRIALISEGLNSVAQLGLPLKRVWQSVRSQIMKKNYIPQTFFIFLLPYKKRTNDFYR